jgi:hypothetical protein
MLLTEERYIRSLYKEPLENGLFLRLIEKIFQLVVETHIFLDCENLSGCPIGRPGASRRSSSGTELRTFQ